MRTGSRRKPTPTDPPPPLPPLPPGPPPLPFQTKTHDQLNFRKQVETLKDGGDDVFEFNEEENEGNKRSEDNGGGDEERPQLGDGFYEIETVRKKRVRKGVKQYLIKWRGWPESANSWEPVESFAACPDVLEAFESMGSGTRKRKRKHSVGSISQSKKKQQQQQDSHDAAYLKPCVETEVSKEPSSGPCVQDSNVIETNDVGASYNETGNQSHESDEKLNEINAASSMNQENVPKFAIHIQEDPVPPANVVSEVDGTEICRTSPRIGARRRKSCTVKRFKTESSSAPKKDASKETAATDAIVQDDTKNADDVVNRLDSKNTTETRQIATVITKIIKPVNYLITTINGTEEVFVSFVVTRSDGEEIVVDNKYLKENNPILLINFYEQHLRYNNPSE